MLNEQSVEPQNKRSAKSNKDRDAMTLASFKIDMSGFQATSVECGPKRESTVVCGW